MKYEFEYFFHFDQLDLKKRMRFMLDLHCLFYIKPNLLTLLVVPYTYMENDIEN